MKKLLLINLAILLSLVGFGQGAFPVPTGKGSIEASEFRQRVADSGGTYYPNVAAHEIDERTSYGLNPVFEYYPAAVETSVAFSQKPTDGTGDFTVARAGIKTRVNEDGYLEEIAANIAAIDYTSGIPALNTEPAATNLIAYSNAFGNTYWTKSGATIEGDASTAGSELITATNDRDFSAGNIGNWVVSTAGAGTCAYSTDLVKEGKLTSSGDTYFWAQLPTSEIATLVDGNMYRVQADVYVPSANTEKDISIGVTDFGLGNSFKATSIPADTWTTIYYDFMIDGDITGILMVGFEAGNDPADGDICYFDNVSVKLITGFSSPSVDYPTDAYKLVEDVGTASDYNFNRNNIVVNNTSNTMSICVKAGERNWVALYDGETNEGYYFDLTNGVVGSALGSAPDSYSITPLVDSWYRISVTVTTTTAKIDWYFYLAESDGGFTYNGDGTSGIYIYGAQLEAGTYPTSPIYTSGATASRIADAITGAGNAALFSSVNSSGVLYAEIGAFVTQGEIAADVRSIYLTDGTATNRMVIRYMGSNEAVNAVNFLIESTGSAAQQQTITIPTAITNFHKYAIRWKVNEVEFWADGAQVGTTLETFVTFTTSTLNDLSFKKPAASNEDFYGNTRTVAVYNYLTDTQMATLTTP